MKRRFAAVLLILALGILMTALPGMAEENYVEIEARDIVVNRYTDVFGFEAAKSNTYCLVNAQCVPITDAIYTYMYPDSNYPFFSVKADGTDGVHCEGLIDDRGNELVPPRYAEVNVISDRWQAGIRLAPSSSDDNDYTYTDYSTDTKTFYRIDAVDFFYRGELVGTLDRSAYGDGYISAYGDYICVTNREKQRVFYNKAMQVSPYESEYSGEYDELYVKGDEILYHQGTGQIAFDPGCTLTQDEVRNSLHFEDGVMYDLQGNEVFRAAQYYDYLRENDAGEYFIVHLNNLEGLIDRQGNEIIPIEYDELGYIEDRLLQYGCISAVKDGKFGFLDASGNVTCEFNYIADVVSNRTCFGTIKNFDGKTIVLSGLGGELPEHFTDTYFVTNASAFAGANDAGQWTLISLDGTTLIPYLDVSSGSSIRFNLDASLVAVYMGDRVYRIYTFPERSTAAADAGEPVAETRSIATPKPVVPPQPVATPEPAATPEPVAQPAVTPEPFVAKGPLDVTVTSVQLKGTLIYNENSDAVAFCEEGSDSFRLLDASGEPLTDAVYRKVTYDYSSGMFLVTADAEDGIHGAGIVDAAGNEIVPTRYAFAKVISDRWQIGVMMREAAEGEPRGYIAYDRESGGKRYYAVDHADVYWMGSLVGTIDGADYGSMTAYGDYIALRDVQGRYTYYGPDFTKSPVEPGNYYSEYDSEYNYPEGYTYTHLGTGQTAFVPGCTLTADEVRDPLQQTDDGTIVDLQGREVFSIDVGDSYFYMNGFYGDYSVVSLGNAKGVIDKSGNLIIPIEYDDVGQYEDNPLRYGYISVKKDGLLGFVDAGGNVTVEPSYQTEQATVNSDLAVIRNLDGTFTVVTGAVGELDECFDQVLCPWDGAEAFAVRKDSQWAVYDLYGQRIIDYTDASYLEVNADATLAVAYLDDGQYELYRIEHNEPEPSADGNGGGAAEADAGWTCENGHAGNMGNFCSECGSPRPVETSGVVCPTCGAAYAADSAPKFCPECGTRIGE